MMGLFSYSLISPSILSPENGIYPASRKVRGVFSLGIRFPYLCFGMIRLSRAADWIASTAGCVRRRSTEIA